MNTVRLKLDETLRDGRWHERGLTIGERHLSIMLRQVQAGCWQAFVNACPHQGRRMDFAQDQFLVSPNGSLVCPAHGAEFRPDDGFCVTGPCRGASLQILHIEENPHDQSLILSGPPLTSPQG